MATKMRRKPHIFYSLSHIKEQVMISERFIIYNCFLVSLERNDLYFNFKCSTSAVFDVFTATTTY